MEHIKTIKMENKYIQYVSQDDKKVNTAKANNLKEENTKEKLKREKRSRISLKTKER